MEKAIEYKGGSLSRIYKLESGRVRKEVSIHENIEYGYQRWYSQLKKLQRYNVLFPGIFPNIYGFGVDNGVAFYDMEFIEGVTGYEFLSSENADTEIRRFFSQFRNAMTRMHHQTIPSNSTALTLYYDSEIRKTIEYCYKSYAFAKLFRSPMVRHYGIELPSFISQTSIFQEELSSNYLENTETFTHGNLTLENLIYNRESRKITFIDPYDETIIDSRLCDYSQILQSCNSNYELLNAGGDIANVSPGMSKFNILFKEYLQNTFASDERSLKAIDLLEISQFIRMLPFKLEAGKTDKAIFFYCYASKLLCDYKVKWNLR